MKQGLLQYLKNKKSLLKRISTNFFYMALWCKSKFN